LPKDFQLSAYWLLLLVATLLLAEGSVQMDFDWQCTDTVFMMPAQHFFNGVHHATVK